MYHNNSYRTCSEQTASVYVPLYILKLNTYISEHVAAIQCITSSKNHKITTFMTCFANNNRVNKAFSCEEIMFVLIVIKSHIKRSYDKQNITLIVMALIKHFMLNEHSCKLLCTQGFPSHLNAVEKMLHFLYYPLSQLIFKLQNILVFYKTLNTFH